MTSEENVEKRYNDSEPLRKADKGMGKTAEAAESELLKEINEYAQELGIETDMTQVNTHSRFSQNNNSAVLYGETYGGVQRWMGETTAFLYDNDAAQKKSYQDPNGAAVRLGNGDLKVNEKHHRAAGDWLQTQGNNHRTTESKLEITYLSFSTSSLYFLICALLCLCHSDFLSLLESSFIDITSLQVPILKIDSLSFLLHFSKPLHK